MTQQTLVIPDLTSDLVKIRDEINALRRLMEQVTMLPKPEWMSVHDYAAYIGKSSRTVNRMITDGKVELKLVAGIKMVKV